MIARWSHIIYDGFTNENDAMSFAQELNQATTIGSPQASPVMEIAPLRVTPPTEVTIEGALADAGHPAP